MTTFNHQQTKRFKPLPVGTLSSGREVLEIIRAADTRTALYRIRYGCCGHVGEIGHVALRIGVRRDKEQPDAPPVPCRSCACVDAAARQRSSRSRRSRACMIFAATSGRPSGCLARALA